MSISDFSTSIVGYQAETFKFTGFAQLFHFRRREQISTVARRFILRFFDEISYKGKLNIPGRSSYNRTRHRWSDNCRFRPAWHSGGSRFCSAVLFDLIRGRFSTHFPVIVHRPNYRAESEPYKADFFRWKTSTTGLTCVS